MSCSCPTCGREIDFQDFRYEAASGIAVGKGRFATLTAREAAVFEVLWARPSMIFTREQLLSRVYSLFADDAPELKIIDVFICKIRKKLAGLGVDIESVWGHGYRLKKGQA